MLKSQEMKRKELEKERDRQKELQDDTIIAAKLREAKDKAEKGNWQKRALEPSMRSRNGTSK